MLAVEPATLGLFALAAGAVVVSPGPDTLLILRNTIASGRAAGLATVAGVQVGLAVHTLLAVLGISLVIASSPALFRAVAVAGAGYLAWLGIEGLKGGGALALDREAAPVALGRACLDAILTNLLNPKVILLFLALFPNFVDTGRGGVPAQLLTLAATLVAINILWQAPMAWAGGWVRRRLARPGMARGVARATGAVFLAIAAAMLAEHLG